MSQFPVPEKIIGILPSEMCVKESEAHIGKDSSDELSTQNGLKERGNLHCFSNLFYRDFNPLKPELNPICYLLTLLGAHHFLHVSTIRIKSLTLRLLMSYIHGAPILDVSRSHTTTQHSR